MAHETEVDFKKSYNYIFSFFYLVQGLHDGIQAIVLPVYLISLVDNIDLSFILMILSVTALPWSFKFFIGLFNDKYGSERFGRRRPWIIIFGALSGLWWIILGSFLTLVDDIIIFTMICAFMFNLGLAVADTSIDGLMLDVTPRDKLGKIQASTWSLYLLGSMTGGIMLGILFSMYNLIPILFILEGILMISCTLSSYVIQEVPPKDVKVWRGLKEIVLKGKNWKIFISTFAEAIPKNVVPLLFGILLIVYMPNSPIETDVITISLAGSSLELIFLFGIISAISGIGIIAGCALGGKIADKNRRLSVYIGHVILIPVVLFCVFSQSILSFAIVMVILLGMGQGAVRTSYQVVRSDLAQKYPELNATFYAMIISFLNSGISVGYAIVGMLLTFFSDSIGITDFKLTFFYIMLILTLIQLFSLIVFSTIKRDEYEIKEEITNAEVISVGEVSR